MLVRCSALPRIDACPASAVPPTVRIESPSEAAAMGSAVHEYLAVTIRDAVDAFVDVLAAKHGVEPEDLATSCRVALSLWRKVAEHFPDPVTEHTFEPVLWTHCPEHDFHSGFCVGPCPSRATVSLTGTADVLSVSPDGNTIMLCDFKTGHLDGDYEQQLRGYAWLALNEDLGAERVKTVVLRTRLGVIDVEEWTREELNAWADALFRRMLAERDIYRPSVEACGYCPRAHECPARRTMMRNAMVFLGDCEAVVDSVPVALGDCIGRAVDAARLVERMCEQVIEIAKAEVIAAGGSIPLPDGRELIVKDVERTEISYALGETVLRNIAGEGPLLPLLKIGKGDVEDLVRKCAPPRGKKAAVEALMSNLDAAGALKISVSQRLELVKAPKLVEAVK